MCERNKDAGRREALKGLKGLEFDMCMPVLSPALFNILALSCCLILTSTSNQESATRHINHNSQYIDSSCTLHATSSALHYNHKARCGKTSSLSAFMNS